MSENLRVLPYNPHFNGEEYLDGVIDCYQKSFAGPPWDELFVCDSCGANYGDLYSTLFIGAYCPKCGGVLSEYWPRETVRRDFMHETTTDASEYRHPSSWIAVIGTQVVGICWGYTITPRKLEKKVELVGLEEVILNSFGAEAKFVAYQDELAVVGRYRSVKFNGKSIARHLVEARHTDFIKLGAKIGIGRTLKSPPTKTYLWYTAAGFREILSYQDNPNRIIFGCKYDSLTY